MRAEWVRSQEDTIRRSTPAAQALVGYGEADVDKNSTYVGKHVHTGATRT